MEAILPPFPAPTSHVLRRTELLLFLARTMTVPHKWVMRFGVKIPKSFLGQHLIGTYDLLVAAGCDIDVATAGALHSLYGTDKYQRVTILPTTEERRRIRERFGERAERLAYLFHACNRISHPKSIELGRLLDRRCGVPLPGVSVDDVQGACTPLPLLRDPSCRHSLGMLVTTRQPTPLSFLLHPALRLIEAANMIEQGEVGSLRQNLPTVLTAWRTQLAVLAHRRALAEPFPRAWWAGPMPRWGVLGLF
jgi:hypothetical protein